MNDGMKASGDGGPVTVDSDTAATGWARVAPRLIGEALRFEGGAADGREGLVVGVADDAFLVYAPGLAEPGPAPFSFDGVTSITPLDANEAANMRMHYCEQAGGPLLLPESAMEDIVIELGNEDGLKAP